jgi:hypothetical protein
MFCIVLNSKSVFVREFRKAGKKNKFESVKEKCRLWLTTLRGLQGTSSAVFCQGIQLITSGSVGGVALVAVGHPFDTVKVKMVMDKTSLGGTVNAIAKGPSGPLGFYAGAMSPLAGWSFPHLIYSLRRSDLPQLGAVLHVGAVEEAVQWRGFIQAYDSLPESCCWRCYWPRCKLRRMSC